MAIDAIDAIVSPAARRFMTAKSCGVAISMMSTDIRIKQYKKVPDGFKPVRDRSREVSS